MSNKHIRPRWHRASVTAGMVVAILATCVIRAAPARAAEVTLSDPFYASLAAPQNAVIDGRGFAAALEEVARRTKLNMWIDRGVDRNRIIRLGTLGPTTFAVIERIAGAADCVVMPYRSVVLVGRKSWVRRTIAAMDRAHRPTAMDRGVLGGAVTTTVSLAWPEGTRPSELGELLSKTGGAIAPVADDFNSGPRLDYDLMAAGTLRGVDARDAAAMLASQFTRPAEGSLQAGSTSELQLRLDYRAANLTRVRRQILAVDPAAEFARRGEVMGVRASIDAHRTGVCDLLRRAGAQGRPAEAAAPPPDAETRFDLKIVNKTAAEVLLQLAAAGGRGLKIDATAMRACDKLVSLQAEQRTLEQLCEAVAAKVGVQLVWTSKVVIVRLASRPN